MNRRWKEIAQWCGIAAFLGGLLLFPGGLIWFMVWISEMGSGSGRDARSFGIVWLTLVTLLLGGGNQLYRHASQSLKSQVSPPLRLPAWWVFAWGLPLLIIAGEFLKDRGIGGLFFPPIFLLAGALAPVAVIAWAYSTSSQALTVRKFTLAFLLGSTLAVLLAVGLEILIPAFFFALVEGLADWFRAALENLMTALSTPRVAAALSSPAFVLAFVHLTVVAPVVEELVKPLAVLPLIRHAAGPRQAFLVGAVAGAGFAALENLLYAGGGLQIWGGIVAVRAVGAAIHPLGSGLVSLGWYTLFHPPPGKSQQEVITNDWLSRFAVAVGIHALWNGGGLLVITLAGARFFGNQSPKLELLGLTGTGLLLALLVVVGVAAWAGFTVAARTAQIETQQPGMETVSERAIALWAVLCLVAVLPMGLAALTILGRLP